MNDVHQFLDLSYIMVLSHFFWYISTKNTKRCPHVLSYWLHDTCQGQTEWYMMADATPDWGLDLISPFCSFYIEVLFNSDNNCQQKARDERSLRTMFWYSTIIGSHLSAKHICQHTRTHNRHLILDLILPPLILAFCSFWRSSDPPPFLKVLWRPNMLAANTSAGSL